MAPFHAQFCFRSARPGANASQQATQSGGILWRMGIVVVIKVDPNTLRPASLNPVCPVRQLFLRIIMPVPTLWTMQTDIYLVCRADELIRQSWSAAGAEYYACLAKGAVNLFIPPALVPEFHDVAPAMI